MTKEFTAINLKIRADNKTRLDHFQAWLNYNYPHKRKWTQSSALDVIMSDTHLWRAYLNERGVE